MNHVRGWIVNMSIFLFGDIQHIQSQITILIGFDIPNDDKIETSQFEAGLLNQQVQTDTEIAIDVYPPLR